MNVLRIGDLLEINCVGYPPPAKGKEWILERVREIRVVADEVEKEGLPVSCINWSDVIEHRCHVIVICTRHWGRNEHIRRATWMDS